MQSVNSAIQTGGLKITFVPLQIGRTSAEFFNIKTLIKNQNRIKIKGIEIIDKYKDKGVIYVSGHLANWEIIPIAIMNKDKKVAAVFRESNNFLFNNWMIKQRKLITENQFPKGISGTKEILNFLKNNGSVAMLVDQKLSNGVKAKFFNMNAMTASVPATLALKYGYPVVPLNVSRIKNVNFEIEFFPMIEIAESAVESQPVGTGDPENALASESPSCARLRS